MGREHQVQGVDFMPIYLVARGELASETINEDDFIDTVPLTDLVARLKPGEHIYYVDYTVSTPGTKLVRLV